MDEPGAGEISELVLRLAGDCEERLARAAVFLHDQRGTRLRGEAPMYALFRGKTQLGGTFATEREVWEAALIEGLVTDVPVADEEGGQILPRGYQVRPVEETYDHPQPVWKPRG